MSIESTAMLVLAALGLLVHSLIRFARMHNNSQQPEATSRVR
ncbi:hypothetical protein C6A87_027955 [Mycobacterium sp. ITM-2016-00317]|nr:hypothetical protein [Mycobacterium sp. ITM-2016-00317]WNG87517.1 hypothetical protein C6A87_027955 [Mycobacterium sp. ITM-2016-00317]